MIFAVAIIPVYNHGTHLGAVLDACLRQLSRDRILVVDDGSTDFSSAEAGRRLVHIRRHEKNMGKGQALITGFTWAMEQGAEWVLTLDSDGQHNPDEIPLFFREAEKGQHDFVIGAREFTLARMPLPRYFSNSVSSGILSRMTGTRILDSQSGYRMIRTSLLRKMSLQTTDYLLETEMILYAARLGGSIGFVPISTIYQGEKSHIPTFRIMGRFLKTVWANRKKYAGLIGDSIRSPKQEKPGT